MGGARGSRTWSQIGFEADRDSILRMEEGYALQLVDRERDARRVDDQVEEARELPLQAQRAQAEEEADAARARAVEIHEQDRGAHLNGRSKVESLVCERKAQHGGRV